MAFLHPMDGPNEDAVRGTRGCWSWSNVSDRHGTGRRSYFTVTKRPFWGPPPPPAKVHSTRQSAAAAVGTPSTWPLTPSGQSVVGKFVDPDHPTACHQMTDGPVPPFTCDAGGMHRSSRPQSGQSLAHRRQSLTGPRQKLPNCRHLFSKRRWSMATVIRYRRTTVGCCPNCRRPVTSEVVDATATDGFALDGVLRVLIQWIPWR